MTPKRSETGLPCDKCKLLVHCQIYINYISNLNMSLISNPRPLKTFTHAYIPLFTQRNFPNVQLRSLPCFGTLITDVDLKETIPNTALPLLGRSSPGTLQRTPRPDQVG